MKKKDSIPQLIKHCVIYMAAYLIVIIPIFSYEMLISGLIISLLHAVIDIVKFVFIKYKRKKPIPTNTERKVYIIDQAAHLLCLAIVAYVMIRNDYQFYVTPALDEFYQITGGVLIKDISWIVIILIIYKPANISIKQMLSMYKPEEDPEEINKNNDKKTGAFIGLLERIIILIFLSIGQYSAIGLVLTAKSVARYDKISKDKNFAEYYLLGTLLSTVIVIVVYFILF